mgnify:CR=1 FL=1
MEKDDLISRSALMKYINEHHCYSGLPMAAHICTMELLTYAPTVDAVEVVHGRWINTPPYRALNGSYNKAQECSVCHAFFVSPGNTPYSNHPYCCECGARMDMEGINE